MSVSHVQELRKRGAVFARVNTVRGGPARDLEQHPPARPGNSEGRRGRLEDGSRKFLKGH